MWSSDLCLQRTSQSLDNLLESSTRETEDKVFHSAENLLDIGPTRESLGEYSGASWTQAPPSLGEACIQWAVL